ncbi:DUSAM domain-containing protein [Stigmatella hybrida]|uniref:DUSAM domain-containing protein n=1 Tax=Stigmatella hybrida TaxID=394097 RepID=UPI001CDA6EF7|nr:DUSAM domain-containing protein [Stigmatella hybrida]
MSNKTGWAALEALAQRVLDQGEPLELTASVRAVLRRSARDVAIPLQDIQQALRSPRTSKALLRKVHKRIEEGAWRLMVAEHRAHRLQDAGDLEGARRQLERVLTVERVPRYRKQAEILLAQIVRLQRAANHGRVDPKLSDRSQLACLLYRIQQGKPLKLTGDMRSFLQRAAAEVAFGEAETAKALASSQSAETLLRKIMARLRNGSKRLERAVSRMLDLREAGDLEGARQQMRDVLAVETVPMYRQAAEENLAGLDEPLPAS